MQIFDVAKRHIKMKREQNETSKRGKIAMRKLVVFNMISLDCYFVDANGDIS